ncbi:MAG: L-fucose/L-arabinose isomerase family protein [Caldilineaceae bacterium]|nr:L-fucose/L-arabinose isomerase family protein [Caldilineaceae bacterium]
MDFTQRTYPKARIGLFAVGLAAYWPQFPGLQEKLAQYHQHVADQLADFADVVGLGMIDTSQAAFAAGDRLAREQVDLLICHTATYATSSQVLPIVQQAKVPVLVLNLQPEAALDYENVDTGDWLASCSTCCVPEISNAFHRAGIEFQVVSGMLYDDERVWRSLRSWCQAATAVRVLRGARFGFLGHTYPGMLDMYSDFTQHHGQLGSHVEVLEMCDLKDRVDAATDAQIARKLEEAHALFTIDDSADEASLNWACRVAVGLDQLVADFDLSALAYYYRGTNDNEYERLGAGLILGNSLLTARGIPAAGEGDLKNAVAMKIMDSLGAGGSYTEFYAMDFNEHFVLMGHDGPAHLAIGSRKPVLRGLGIFHGKAGAGISVEFNVKHGPITILTCTQTRDGNLKFMTAEGESIPGPIMRIGNTNSRLKFQLGPAEFVDAWCAEAPTHHCALGVGHVADTVRKFARLKGLRFVEVGA